MEIFCKEQWETEQQKQLQESLSRTREILLRDYAYDITGVTVGIKCLEVKKIGKGESGADYAVIKFSMTLIKRASRLLSLDFIYLIPKSNYQEMLVKLWTVDGEYTSYGTAVLLSRIDTAPDLGECVLKALTHAVILLNDSELVLCEETEMKRQPSAFQATWNMMWGLRNGKLVEHEGVRYLRYDDPTGWYYE